MAATSAVSDDSMRSAVGPSTGVCGAVSSAPAAFASASRLSRDFRRVFAVFGGSGAFVARGRGAGRAAADAGAAFGGLDAREGSGMGPGGTDRVTFRAIGALPTGAAIGAGGGGGAMGAGAGGATGAGPTEIGTWTE